MRLLKSGSWRNGFGALDMEEDMLRNDVERVDPTSNAFIDEVDASLDEEVTDREVFLEMLIDRQFKAYQGSDERILECMDEEYERQVYAQIYSKCSGDGVYTASRFLDTEVPIRVNKRTRTEQEKRGRTFIATDADVRKNFRRIVESATPPADGRDRQYAFAESEKRLQKQVADRHVRYDESCLLCRHRLSHDRLGLELLSSLMREQGHEVTVIAQVGTNYTFEVRAA